MSIVEVCEKGGSLNSISCSVYESKWVGISR